MEIINHGVILGQRPEDYQAGGFTFIPYEVRNPSGDWRPYLVNKEVQFGREDSLSCVSFSALNAIEIQEKFITGIERNYADRWIAKMSGTTREGNYQYKVGDAVRHFGLVSEEDYPAPPNYTFDEYHAEIPNDLKASLLEKGRNWLSKWDVKTEFIPVTKESILKHLKHAPIQIIIPGHAIVNIFCEEDALAYFDTYNPFVKTTNIANVQAAYKYVLTRKSMDNDHIKIINYHGTIFVAFGADSVEQAKQVGKMFGKPVEFNEKNEIQNADITVS